MSTITYRQGNISELDKDLVGSHWEETASNKAKRKIGVRYDVLQQMIDLKVGLLIIAEDAGKVIGYAMWFITPDLHALNNIVGVNDALYISKEYRNRGIGAGLLAYSEKELKAMDIDGIKISMKVYAPFSELVESLGYTLTEYSYMKSIGED